MTVFAAVMTGQGTGAISTIQLFGDNAQDIIKNIFKPTVPKPLKLEPGRVLLGKIINGSRAIDQVTIGCEQPNTFAINCHGNPLIVDSIMRLLIQHSVTPLTAPQLLAKIWTTQKLNSITIEAKLAQLKAKTIQATQLLANQITTGLNKTAATWLNNLKSIPDDSECSPLLDKITTQAKTILEKTQPAKLIIEGLTTCITGPPNTGKSTLLNYLAGRDKAIVTDIKGTTRDWVTAHCHIGPLLVELIDTAGLDETLTTTAHDTIEKQAQQKSIQILQDADLVLLLLDNSQPADQLNSHLAEKIKPKLVLTVLNKSDLPAALDTAKLPEFLTDTVQISAKLGTGIDQLTQKIQHTCHTANFDLQQPIPFTTRHQDLLNKLTTLNSKNSAIQIITELLNGHVRV